MDAVIVPEPPDEDREALLQALEAAEPEPYAGAWRQASLHEGTESEEP